jgi:hypothetical protein
MQPVFYGVGAAVIGIITLSCYNEMAAEKGHFFICCSFGRYGLLAI